MAARLPESVRKEAHRLFVQEGLLVPEIADRLGTCVVTTRKAIKEFLSDADKASLRGHQTRILGRQFSDEALARMKARWEGDNPNFLDKEATAKSARYRAVRRYPVEGNACAHCGKTAQIRHHENENTYDNRPENIVFLCRSCHMKEHHARGCFLRPFYGEP